MTLKQLEKTLQKDFGMINYPPAPWMLTGPKGLLDVAIVGAGMAGMTAAFALLKQGVSNIQLFDSRKKGKEGPWATYARMKTLRSPKTLMGPALDIPNLTFQAWFEAQFGAKKWEKLGKIPTLQWMEYLCWYRKVLNLRVRNNSRLLSIAPHQDHLKLTFSTGQVVARKLILATGREGFGGYQIPDFAKTLPKSKWAHTSHLIDYKKFRGKRVAIIGCSSSAFDAAGTALESGAESVDMFMRRPFIPYANVEKSVSYAGCFEGFFYLSDKERWKFISHCQAKGSPPPVESLRRVEKYKNFCVHSNAKVPLNGYDFYILATGFEIDGTRLEELRSLMPHVMLWKDRGFSKPERMARFPYLGEHFELMEKKKGKAPHLKNIHCFNYGALLSHSFICGDIPGISRGARRVAEGIMRDLFFDDRDNYYEQLKSYDVKDFIQEDFHFI